MSGINLEKEEVKTKLTKEDRLKLAKCKVKVLKKKLKKAKKRLKKAKKKVKK